MPDWSRRQALQAVASAGALALAGCSGETSRSRSAPPDRGDRVTDFEATLVRNADGEPVFLGGEGEDDEGAGGRVGGMHHLTDDDLERLRFRDVSGAAELESFVTATDFDSESVYLLQREVGECYEPRLVGVFREADGVDADFCRALRPADVACDADARDVFAVAIRLPFAGDDFDSVGSGWSSDCDRRPVVPLTEGGEGA